MEHKKHDWQIVTWREPAHDWVAWGTEFKGQVLWACPCGAFKVTRKEE